MLSLSLSHTHRRWCDVHNVRAYITTHNILCCLLYIVLRSYNLLHPILSISAQKIRVNFSHFSPDQQQRRRILLCGGAPHKGRRTKAKRRCRTNIESDSSSFVISFFLSSINWKHGYWHNLHVPYLSRSFALSHSLSTIHGNVNVLC